jgi:hypothetical protein
MCFCESCVGRTVRGELDAREMCPSRGVAQIGEMLSAKIGSGLAVSLASCVAKSKRVLRRALADHASRIRPTMFWLDDVVSAGALADHASRIRPTVFWLEDVVPAGALADHASRIRPTAFWLEDVVPAGGLADHASRIRPTAAGWRMLYQLARWRITLRVSALRYSSAQKFFVSFFQKRKRVLPYALTRT